MRKIFKFLLLVFLLSCKGQKDSREKDKKSEYEIKENEIMQDSNKTVLEKYLAKYIDSINNATTESELPLFVRDVQFDYNNRGLWTSFHNPISVRAQIIDRVSNCKSLMLIIKSELPEFKKKPQIEDGLRPPFIELSLHDLVSRRMEILDCKEN